jgi:hypothetical protein
VVSIETALNLYKTEFLQITAVSGRRLKTPAFFLIFLSHSKPKMVKITQKGRFEKILNFFLKKREQLACLMSLIRRFQMLTGSAE